MRKSPSLACVVLASCFAVGASPSAQARSPVDNEAVVEGVAMYLGVVPAEKVRELPPASAAERSMHRGAAAHSGAYHVNISLFDAATHAQIRDARVVATVGQIGGTGETKSLEPMEINHFRSYGNYFDMPSSGPYRITVVVHRSGSHDASATFEYRHF